MSWSPYTGPEVLEERLWQLMDGYLTTQLVYVVAKLGVADVLAEGPQSAEAVAEQVGAHPSSLRRMLRALVLEGVFEEAEDGRFVLNDVAACLREGVPGSFRGPAIARGELYYAGAAGLLPSALDGRTAFEHVHGERFFDHLARDHDRELAFQASMAGRAELEASAVVPPSTSGRFAGLSTSGAVRASCSGRSSRQRQSCPPYSSTGPAPWSERPSASRRQVSRDASSALSATSSTLCRTAPTPTSSHGSCTTGMTRTPRASWRPAGPR